MSRIEMATQVNVSIDQCYKTLLQFESYPEFLPNVLRVTQKGQPNVWHWQVSCPNDTVLEWDMDIQGAKHQHHSLSWHTVRNADVAHSGALTLQRLDDHKTALHLVIEYQAHAMVSPSEENAKQCVRRCLDAMKAHIEELAGVTTQ